MISLKRCPSPEISLNIFKPSAWKTIQFNKNFILFKCYETFKLKQNACLAIFTILD